MVPFRVFLELSSKMAPIQQPISPLLTILRIKTKILLTSPLKGFKNTRGLDIRKWIFHRANKNNAPDNLLVVQHSMVSTNQKKWCMVIFPINIQKSLEYPL